VNADAECVCLATLRRDGREVLTPVWYVWHGERLWLRTARQFGKVKRLRNDPRLRFAPCDWDGNLQGEWRPGTAELIDAGDPRTVAVDALLDARYGERRAQMSAYLREHGLDPVFVAVTPG
jgi:uncharacterized protein